jgi:hypothetical protein
VPEASSATALSPTPSSLLSCFACTGDFARHVESHGLNGFAGGQRRLDMRSWHFAETVQPHMVRHPHTSLWRVSQHAVFRRPGPTPGPSLCLRVSCGWTIAERVAGARRLRHPPGSWEGCCASVVWGPLPANLVRSVGGAELGICTAFTIRRPNRGRVLAIVFALLAMAQALECAPGVRR